MPEKHLYEYAVIRVVPRVEREEFINVGVILCSIKGKYLECKLNLNEDKILAIDPKADIQLMRNNLNSFGKICCAGNDGGPIAQLDLPSRFRWLTAVRSSMIQTSRPHPGLSNDLDATLQHLFAEYVADAE